MDYEDMTPEERALVPETEMLEREGLETQTTDCGQAPEKTRASADQVKPAVSRCLNEVLELAEDVTPEPSEAILTRARIRRKLFQRFKNWFTDFMISREEKGVDTYGHTMDKARLEDLEDGVEEEIGDALMYAQKERERVYMNGEVMKSCQWDAEVITPLIEVMEKVWVLRGN